MPSMSAEDPAGAERTEVWWLRLPTPALSLLNGVLLAATNPTSARRLSFVAIAVFPGAVISFVLGVVALIQLHPEHAAGLWAWSAFLFALGGGIVGWAVRSANRGLR